MRGYIEATENTAMRLKHLSDDMFKYSLAFGDIKKTVKLEEYDFIMLNEQIFSEHFLLMRENGYDIQVEVLGDEIREGTLVRTDAPNLMRIVDNIFSNIRKYADKNFPIIFIMRADKDELIMECRNKIQTDTEGAESNGIGLKTCVRLGSLVAKKFEYHRDGDEFVTRLVLEIKSPQENEE
jgi:signal transduction histidine kinase